MIPQPSNFALANAALAKKPWHVLSISGFPFLLTAGQGSGAIAAGAKAWISKMGEYSQDVNDKEGSSSNASMSIEVIDKDAQITAQFPGFTFEGKTATILTGFPGGAYPGDFLIVATLVIDSVDSAQDNTVYTFHLSDLSAKMNQYIYATGDDGYPTGSNHTRTIAGNPMDILTDVFSANQLNLAANLNTAAVAALKSTLHAGNYIRFKASNAPTAKDFLDRELFMALGGYSFWNYAGLYTPVYFIPSAAPVAALALNDHNVSQVPSPAAAELINWMIYRLDYNGNDFQNEIPEAYAPAINAFGLQQLKLIESRGAQSIYGGYGFGRLLAHTLFLRYGGDPTAANPGKSLLLDLKGVFWNAVILEPGDYVQLTHNKVPNRTTGAMGVTNRWYEVLGFKKNFDSGLVDLKLLDVNWLGLTGATEIAPDGTPAYAAASGGQRAAYQFVCSAVSGLYSNGDAGHPIF